MNLPDFMIYQSFRYCLGRQTYAVSTWVDWAIKNWNNISKIDQKMIIKEIREAFVDCDSRLVDIDKQKWRQLFDYTNKPAGS